MAGEPESISKIAVRGFKSISDEQQIELRPLTLLAGANSSGKSSLMQPVLLLKQTLEAPSDPGALLLDGPNVRFTSAEQLLSHIGPKTCKPEFTVRIELSEGRNLEIVFNREMGVGFEIGEMNYSQDGVKLRILPTMSSDEIRKALSSAFHFHIYTDNENAELDRPKESSSWSVCRQRCFLGFRLPQADLWAPEWQTEDSAWLLRLAARTDLSPGGWFAPHLQSLIHLPGLRGNPQRTYPKRAFGPLFPGTFEDYVASVITQWQSKNDPRLSQLGAALEDMGLTWKVEAQPVDDTQVELRVGRLVHSKQGEEHDLVSVADVGFGVSQSLPVVVALITAEPGQVVYLEQPEMHLHPRAQRRLAHVLAGAANRGVVVVAETHSALLLREVQTIVATGKLSADKVKLHWVQRQEDGRTIVTPADLDSHGAFGDWPEDFDEVELDAQKAYLDAVESKRAGE